MRWILLTLWFLGSELMAGKEARCLLAMPHEPAAGFWDETRSETLAEDFLQQRKLGWNFWEEMMRPAGRFLVWQTWYTREDLQRVFQHLYKGLGSTGRRQRKALSLASIEAALDWNDQGQFQEPGWDRARFQAWLAAYDSEEKMRAVPGLPKILFNRSALIFLLQNYQLLEKCQNKAVDCQALSWPDQVVFIKTSWRRGEDGFHVDRFASDAAALRLQWQKPQWTADASFDPDDAAAFALRLPTGQKFHLVGMHASLRINAQWYWTSLWTDPEAIPEEGEALPWPSRLCAVYGWNRALMHQTIDTRWPSGIAAQALLQKKQGAEYGENIATFPPGTPEFKVAAPSAPSSSSKKRFGWSKQSAQQHEDLAPGTVTSCAVREALTFASSALRSCNQYCASSTDSGCAQCWLHCRVCWLQILSVALHRHWLIDGLTPLCICTALV